MAVSVLVFTGTTSFALKDYRIDYDLGLASQEVELLLSDKGIHKQEIYSNTAGDQLVNLTETRAAPVRQAQTMPP